MPFLGFVAGGGGGGETASPSPSPSPSWFSRASATPASATAVTTRDLIEDEPSAFQGLIGVFLSPNLTTSGKKEKFFLELEKFGLGRKEIEEVMGWISWDSTEDNVRVEGVTEEAMVFQEFDFFWLRMNHFCVDLSISIHMAYLHIYFSIFKFLNNYKKKLKIKL